MVFLDNSELVKLSYCYLDSDKCIGNVWWKINVLWMKLLAPYFFKTVFTVVVCGFFLKERIKMQRTINGHKNVGIKLSILTVLCLRGVSYKFDDVFIWNVYCFAKKKKMLKVSARVFSHAAESLEVSSIRCVRYFIFVWWFVSSVQKRLLSFLLYVLCMLLFFFLFLSFAQRKIVVIVTDASFSTLCDFFSISIFFFFLYLFCFVFILAFFIELFFPVRILWSLVNWLEL